MIEKEPATELTINPISIKTNSTDSRRIYDNFNFDELKDIDYMRSAKNMLKRLKRSDAIYENIFNHANVGIVYINEKGRIILANRFFQKLSQYSLTELKELDFSTLIYPEDLLAEPPSKKLRNEEMHSREQRYTRKDGKLIWTITQSTYFREDPAAPLHAVMVIHDTTDKKEYEQQLLESNAMKDKFLSILSHDLRNPLVSIKMLSTFIKEELEQNSFSEIAELSDLITKQVDHTQNLLNDLLEWSRAQTKQISFMPQQLDIKEIFNDQIAENRIFADNKNIKIEYSVAKQLSVTADKNMLKTILRNLITNAIKFSYPKSKITLKAEKRPDDVLIAVEDNGMGILPAILEKLFRSDVKTHMLGTNNEKGTGLGLLICKEFVEFHQGKIWVETESGKGSKFLFSLPI